MSGLDSSENAPPKCSSASHATSKPSESRELDELEHLGVALGVRLSLRLRRLKEEAESHRGRSQITGAGARGIVSHCAGSWP